MTMHDCSEAIRRLSSGSRGDAVITDEQLKVLSDEICENRKILAELQTIPVAAKDRSPAQNQQIAQLKERFEKNQTRLEALF